MEAKKRNTTSMVGKRTTSVTISSDLIDLARKKGIILSHFFEKTLKNYLFLGKNSENLGKNSENLENLEEIEAKLLKKTAEMIEIKEKKDEIKKKIEKEREEASKWRELKPGERL